MNKQTLALSLSTLLLTSTQAMATPIEAVIGLNTSQVIENTQAAADSAHTLALTPVTGSLLPLDKTFRHLSQPIQSRLPNWSEQIGHSIQVNNKHYALSFSGTLQSLDTQNQTFTLATKGTKITLPTNDFYLVPLEKSRRNATTDTVYQGLISYQSNQLSWQPKRSFIIQKGTVSVINMASIRNMSDKTLTLNKSVLHYSHQAKNQLRSNRSLEMMSAKADPQVTYSDSEITYPLQSMTLPANSDTLMAMSQASAKIDSDKGVASTYTSLATNEQTLAFHKVLSFTLNQAALPGQYSTYWQRDGLLIPGNHVSVLTGQKNQTLDVSTNKSQDLTGTLKRISTSSKKLPARQEWELTVNNVSNTLRPYSVTQNTQGVIANIQATSGSLPSPIKQTSNRLEFDGSLAPHQSKTIRYTLELSE